MNQYNWEYRIYKNGQRLSSSFSDLAQGNMGVRIRADMYYPYTQTRTPFRNVWLVPYYTPPDLQDFLDRLIPAKPQLMNVWNDLKKGIVKGWMPGRIHVVGSSSGYDSRVLAKALQELRKEKGDLWYGKTYFVECSGEGKGFEKIMNKLGIKEYIIDIPDYNFEYFQNIHRRFNGLCAYPMNLWYDYFIKHWKQEEIQYISGYGGNVADAMRLSSPYMLEGYRKKRLSIQGRLDHYFKKQYYYQIAAFRKPKYSLHPFWTWQYINAVAGLEHKGARTAVFLADNFVPECSRIRRMTILGDVTGAGLRTAKEIKKMYEWFKSTRYGRQSTVKPNAKIEYNRWWLEYCIADYVQANNIDLC